MPEILRATVSKHLAKCHAVLVLYTETGLLESKEEQFFNSHLSRLITSSFQCSKISGRDCSKDTDCACSRHESIEPRFICNYKLKCGKKSIFDAITRRLPVSSINTTFTSTQSRTLFNQLSATQSFRGYVSCHIKLLRKG